MSQRTWLITGVSGGFGRELTDQLLECGDRVVGTVRDIGKVADLIERYPEAFHVETLDVTDTAAIREVVERSFARLGRIDVVISNAGYGLFGAAEEFTDEQIDHMIATNLVGSIQLIRAALPHLRAQGGGRIIQISSYGGQVAFPGNSMYHATKWGIEGFVESVAQEVAPFGIGMTIVEPGGARTEFRYGSAQVAKLTPTYDNNPAHAFLQHARSQERSCPRRPRPNGRAHHRERRYRACAAAHSARLAGAGEHAFDTAQAHRGLRGADQTRRFDGFPAWRVIDARGILMKCAHKHMRILASNRAKRRLLDSRVGQRSDSGDASTERRRETMEIKRNGSRPSAKGPAEYFTGTVRIDPLFQCRRRRAGRRASPSRPAPAPRGTPIRSARP